MRLELIGKKKKLDKWVPHRLAENQQNRRLEVASSLLLRHRNEPFLKRLITCDENGYFSIIREEVVNGRTLMSCLGIAQSQIFSQKRSWSVSGGGVYGIMWQIVKAPYA
jgi:hypothetical protein